MFGIRFNENTIPQAFNSIPRLIVEVLNDQNLFTELNLAKWFSSYVEFCSDGHLSERAEATWQIGKMNHLKQPSYEISLWLQSQLEFWFTRCNMWHTKFFQIH